MENWLIDNIWFTVNNDFINKLIVVKYEDLLDESYLVKLFDKLVLHGLKRTSDKVIIPKLGEVEHSKFNYPDDHLENLRNKKTYYLTDLQKQTAFAQLSNKVNDFVLLLTKITYSLLSDSSLPIQIGCSFISGSANPFKITSRRAHTTFLSIVPNVCPSCAVPKAGNIIPRTNKIFFIATHLYMVLTLV